MEYIIFSFWFFFSLWTRSSVSKGISLSYCFHLVYFFLLIGFSVIFKRPFYYSIFLFIFIFRIRVFRLQRKTLFTIIDLFLFSYCWCVLFPGEDFLDFALFHAFFNFLEATVYPVFSHVTCHILRFKKFLIKNNIECNLCLFNNLRINRDRKKV